MEKWFDGHDRVVVFLDMQTDDQLPALRGRTATGADGKRIGIFLLHGGAGDFKTMAGRAAMLASKFGYRVLSGTFPGRFYFDDPSRDWPGVNRAVELTVPAARGADKPDMVTRRRNHLNPVVDEISDKEVAIRTKSQAGGLVELPLTRAERTELVKKHTRLRIHRDFVV